MPVLEVGGGGRGAEGLAEVAVGLGERFEGPDGEVGGDLEEDLAGEGGDEGGVGFAGGVERAEELAGSGSETAGWWLVVEWAEDAFPCGVEGADAHYGGW